MRLPASHFHQFLGLYAVGPLQQFQHLGGFASITGAGGFLRAFRRFLAELAFFPGLPFFGATWAGRAPGWAFFVALGSAAEVAGAVSGSGVDVMVSPCAVITTVTTWIALNAPGLQDNSARSSAEAIEGR
jgi:hypothetical protein